MTIASVISVTDSIIITVIGVSSTDVSGMFSQGKDVPLYTGEVVVVKLGFKGVVSLLVSLTVGGLYSVDNAVSVFSALVLGVVITEVGYAVTRVEDVHFIFLYSDFDVI